MAAGVRAFELTGAYRFAIVDVPLLFETGGNERFDVVIVTACSAERQIARLLERGLTEAAARQRLAAQWPTERKTAKADYIVRTDGTFEDTDRQIAEVYEKLAVS